LGFALGVENRFHLIWTNHIALIAIWDGKAMVDMLITQRNSVINVEKKNAVYISCIRLIMIAILNSNNK